MNVLQEGTVMSLQSGKSKEELMRPAFVCSLPLHGQVTTVRGRGATTAQ